MSHKCDAIMFHCIDFRLIDNLKDWMQENNLMNNCDTVAIAGSSKAFLDEEKEVVDFLLKQIQLSTTLHEAKKVILVHHSDCGAYKADYNFENEEEEFDQQTQDMDMVADMISNCFGELEIEKIWIKLKDQEGNQVEFQRLP